MDTPATTDPPYLPIGRSGWPVRRTPMWVLLAALMLADGTVLTGHG
ncbi:MAG: hypothetical protein ACRDPY_06020 [Streptosporangiaceae bacterium]